MTTVNVNIKEPKEELIPFGSIILIDTHEGKNKPLMLILRQGCWVGFIELDSGKELVFPRGTYITKDISGVSTKELQKIMSDWFGSDTSFKVLRNTTININGEVDD